MGRQNHILQPRERMEARGQLLSKDIDPLIGVNPRTRQPSFLKRRVERRLIDQRPARGVDQIGRRLHLAQRGLINQMIGRFIQRQM